MIRPVLLALIAFSAAACTRARPQSPLVDAIEAPTRYRLDLRADFDTAVEGEPAVLGPALVAALAETGRFSERWQMDLDLGLIRRFRDDSRGDLLQIRSAQVAVGPGPDASPGPWAQSALSGLSAELRRFEDGEILAVDHSEHLAGGDRQFEVLDFILPVISPKVPSMRSGEALTTNTRWPLMLGALGKLTGMLRADWALEGSERLEGLPCWRIRYGGDWLSRLRQGQGDRRSWVEAEAMGQASGTLWMSKADGGLVRHDFRWSRVLRLPLHGSADSVLAQSQAFSGSLVRR